MSEFPQNFSAKTHRTIRSTTSRSRSVRRALATVIALSAITVCPAGAFAQKTEKLTKALSQKPLQDEVPFDTVPADKIEQCDIEEVTRPDGKGFLVTGESGQTLRWFVDTNGDNKLDRWCYFSQGVETYREIDSDFDKVADQFRWLGTAAHAGALTKTKMARSIAGKLSRPRKSQPKSSKPLRRAMAIASLPW